MEDYKKKLNEVSRNIVDLFEEAGILYVPIPALSEEEFESMSKESQEKTMAILDFNIDLEKTIN